MSGKNKQKLSTQLEVCKRRLEGHGYKLDEKGRDTDDKRNENSNPDRFFRLLMREASLSSQLNASKRKSLYSGRSKKVEKAEKGAENSSVSSS